MDNLFNKFVKFLKKKNKIIKKFKNLRINHKKFRKFYKQILFKCNTKIKEYFQ